MYDDWTFPKGKDDPGESPERAALREVWEETGYRARIISPVGDTAYRTSTGPKVVRWFLMKEAGNGGFSPTSEIDQIRWVSIAEAAHLLTYQRDRNLLSGLDLGRLAVATIYLVRHGAAGSRSDWKGNDRLRPLTDKGFRQAEGLVEALGDCQIDRIITSPYLRCRQTVDPLAAHLNLPIEEDERLAEASDEDPVARLLESVSNTNTVLCSHGDVIPMALDRLVREGMKLDSPFECKKASVWIIGAEDGTFVSAEYLPPPRV
jgi:8-oxo-(d)GTP phosphatase